uniref:Large ribosomal subunit protein bL33c n=1 Tax=Gronococcus sybilensis TaxID=3028029 RepID=A0A9Y1MX86_9RHOD|nr:ribosomal protein L33 [Gronococcus sybilensis]
MAKSKSKTPRTIIHLECIECRFNIEKRSNGVSRYSSTKNRKNSSARIELRKFCTYCNTRTVHKETK